METRALKQRGCTCIKDSTLLQWTCLLTMAGMKWRAWIQLTREMQTSSSCGKWYNNFSYKYSPQTIRNVGFFSPIKLWLSWSVLSTENLKMEQTRKPKSSRKLERQWHTELTWMEASEWLDFFFLDQRKAPMFLMMWELLVCLLWTIGNVSNQWYNSKSKAS